MQICFIKDGTSLTLPVTPAGYSWAVGRNMETINISQLGDVYRPGGRSRFAGNPLECLLPGPDYPWMEPGAVANPQYYLDVLTSWAAAGGAGSLHRHWNGYQYTGFSGKRRLPGAGRNGRRVRLHPTPGVHGLGSP